jgi:hypothetical protein
MTIFTIIIITINITIDFTITIEVVTGAVALIISNFIVIMMRIPMFTNR